MVTPPSSYDTTIIGCRAVLGPSSIKSEDNPDTDNEIQQSRACKQNSTQWVILYRRVFPRGENTACITDIYPLRKCSPGRKAAFIPPHIQV